MSINVSGGSVSERWQRFSTMFAQFSRHFKRRCVQYNNKLGAQRWRLRLDSDCRIKTNLIEQTGPRPPGPADACWGGGHSLALWGCEGGAAVECLAQTSPGLHVSTTTVHACVWVCVSQATGEEIMARSGLCVCDLVVVSSHLSTTKLQFWSVSEHQWLSFRWRFFPKFRNSQGCL